MDIYDILRRLVEARPFQQHEQQESIEVIEELRKLNVFGTMAKQVREDHEHQWVPMNYPYGNSRHQRCLICMMEADNGV